MRSGKRCTACEVISAECALSVCKRCYTEGNACKTCAVHKYAPCAKHGNSFGKNSLNYAGSCEHVAGDIVGVVYAGC